MREAEHGYHRAFGLLAKTMQTAKRTIPNSDFVPALVDFAATVGLVAEGEAGVRAMMWGMERRITDWHEGRFPEGGAPKSMRRRKQTNTVVAFLKASAQHEHALDSLLERIEEPARDYVDFANASPLATTDFDEKVRTRAYAAMEDILADTMRRVSEAKVPLPVLLFSLADFLALVTLRMTGDETVLRMQIERLDMKIAEWKAGELGF